jgi:EAL domain-containing protein (putative c-di-GMP-specific phosphodiesterase class I)
MRPTTLPFESYAKLIRTIAPLVRKVLFYDRESNPAWISDGMEEPELRSAVVQFLEEGSRFEDDVAVFPLGAGNAVETFLIFAVRRDDGILAGLLAVVCRNALSTMAPGRPEITRRLLAPVLDVYRHSLCHPPAAAAPRTAGNTATMCGWPAATEHRADLCDTVLQQTAAQVECAFAAIVMPACSVNRYHRTSENESDLSVGAAVQSVQAAMFKWMTLRREPTAINRTKDINGVTGRYKVIAAPVLHEAGEVAGLMLLFRESSSADFLAGDLECARIACRSLSSSYPELRRQNALHQATRTPTQIQRALEDGHFRLYAQRISPLRKSARPARFEVLLRMQNEDAVYAPESFLDMARTGRLMPEIDRWVVRNSLYALNTRAELLCGRNVEFCINVDEQSLTAPGFADFVVEELAGCAVPAGMLVFEIAEPIALKKEAAVESFADRISAAGCRISLDNFGVGAGSLATLSRLPISCVKIAGSLVRDVTTNHRSESLIRGMASMTASMDIETVAERVEQDAVKEKLRTLGIDYAQGFALSRPCPMDEALGEVEYPGRIDRRIPVAEPMLATAEHH